MGNERKSPSKNLKVVKVDTDENLLLVRGAVPGPAGNYIFIRKARRRSQRSRDRTRRRIMPVVDVINLEGKKVGQLDLADDVFWRQGQPAPAARSCALVSGGSARGNAQDEGQERSQRRGPQALEAEGHGPRARRLHSFAALAPWRHGSWTGAAQLRLRAAEKDVAGRAALGPVREAGRREIDGGGSLGARVAQDQGVPACSCEAGWRNKNDFAGGSGRQSQSRTRQPQPRGRDAGRAGRPAAL